MKYLITLILFFVAINLVYPQHTFKYIRHNQTVSVIPMAVIEDTMGNIIVVYEKGVLMELRTCHLMVLSPQGNVISDTEFSMTGLFGNTVIEKVKGSYYIMGNNFINKQKTTFSIYKITANYKAELINSWDFNNQRINRPQIHEIADNRIFLSTGLSDIDAGISNELFFIEFNNQWDTVKTIHFPTFIMYGFRFDKKRQLYIMIGGDRELKANTILLYFDTDLNIIEKFNFLGSTILPGLRRCNDNILVIGEASGIFSDSKSIELIKCDTTGKELETIPLGDENILQQMAYNKSIVNSTNGMFYGYSFQWNGSTPFSETPLPLHLVKFDSSMNIIFEKYYVDNASYSAADFTPASDGGCIMAAMIYDTAYSKQYQGIQILKVDLLGNYTTTDIVEKPLPQSTVSLYPNPGNNTINLKIQGNNKNVIFSLYNIAGKKVLSKQVNAAQTTIKTQYLPTGMYVYELRKNGIVFNRGKWVKQ